MPVSMRSIAGCFLISIWSNVTVDRPRELSAGRTAGLILGDQREAEFIRRGPVVVDRCGDRFCCCCLFVIFHKQTWCLSETKP